MCEDVRVTRECCVKGVKARSPLQERAHECFSACLERGKEGACRAAAQCGKCMNMRTCAGALCVCRGRAARCLLSSDLLMAAPRRGSV
eukprot:352993-Chlamydomonas_euryale.AAC.1